MKYPFGKKQALDLLQEKWKILGRGLSYAEKIPSCVRIVVASPEWDTYIRQGEERGTNASLFRRAKIIRNAQAVAAE